VKSAAESFPESQNKFRLIYIRVRDSVINVNVWPDNDSYNLWQEYDVEKIICEKTIYEEL
jgi:hypothetical protein